MDPNLVLAATVALAVILGGVALASGGDKTVDKRIETVSKRKETNLRRKAVDPEAERRKKLIGGIKDIEAREKQLRKARLSLTARIQQAGLSITPTTFWMGSAGLAVIVALFVFVAGQPLHFIGGAALAAGLGLPRWILGFLVGRRQKKFVQEFAGSIEVIVRGVKSGLPLSECLKIIGREAPEPLGGEFRRLVDQVALGVPFDQALAKMYERMPLSEVSFFSIVLAIQQKAGGNLSEALQNLATVLRSRKLMREKVKALSSEAKASAWIIGALPVAVCVLVGVTSPDYISLLFTDATGQMNLMIGLGMMTMGILVMRNMINFDI